MLLAASRQVRLKTFFGSPDHSRSRLLVFRFLDLRLLSRRRVAIFRLVVPNVQDNGHPRKHRHFRRVHFSHYWFTCVRWTPSHQRCLRNLSDGTVRRLCNSYRRQVHFPPPSPFNRRANLL
jgi:hypothetical protein